MPWNGAGSYSPPAASFPEVNGTVIDADRFNATINDIATGITNCLTLDGQNSPTADIPMGNFTLTGLANATVAGEPLVYGQSLVAAAGTAGAPGVSFSGDSNTGIFSSAADVINFAVGGTSIAGFTADGLGVGTTATANYRIDVSGTIRSIGGETTSGYGLRVLNATQNGGGALTANAGVNGGVALTADAGNVTIGSRFVFLNDGRIYGSDLHNNAGSVSGAATQFIASGTYTPTGTGVNNVTTLTPRKAQWMRVGNVVTVSGLVTVDPTGGALCSFRLSLPIASNFTTGYECAGMARETNTFSGFMIYGDGANNEAYFTTNALTDNGLQDYSYTYQYEVLA